jgi:small-conductance mechanosensitive channel
VASLAGASYSAIVNDTPLEIFGVKLLGVSAATLHKAILTIGFTLAILVVRYLLEVLGRLATRSRPEKRRSFWIRQMSNIVTASLFVLSAVSIWFDDPSRLATGVGLVSAGLAFALQKVVTSLAGYFVIIRSDVFSVGDRINMGGVRGDVISLGFLKTTLMEIGDPAVGSPLVWVHGRQYTGRLVTVTNDKIFEEPVFNSTRDFPFLWEEIPIPITYASDRRRAEKILLESAQRATAETQKDAEKFRAPMNDVYHVDLESLEPRVFFRITDNWLELSLRFLVPDRRSREDKDRISRDILAAFDEAGIGIASTTIDIVAFPPFRRASPDGAVEQASPGTAP